MTAPAGPGPLGLTMVGLQDPATTCTDDGCALPSAAAPLPAADAVDAVDAKGDPAH
jgi:hypothetical protein